MSEPLERVDSCSLLLLDELYLPVNMPPANGDQGVTAISNAFAIGNKSRSGVRSIKLYSICSATNGVQP